MNQERLRDLLIRAMEGDQNAYHFFLKELCGPLRAYFRKRLTWIPDEVEDLVQETLIAIHNHRHTYDVQQPLSAWIYAIARHKMVDMLRRHQRKVEIFVDIADSEHDLLSHSDLNAAEARRDIGKLLGDLPDHQRQPIQSVRLDGMSVTETAKAFGMSPSSVKINVFRGVKALAKKIRKTA
jgi:RNA polymerase sigma-70 factor (ECF subfamily)